MENVKEILNVSRETLCDLKDYQSLLIEWQKKFNLVSNNSLAQSWERHFLDSAQLYRFIPASAQNLIDFGSGAGFPALVLAIMSKTRTLYLNITLVESIKKKTVFLNEVATQLGLNVRIFNQRIENLPKQKFDVITSRAMCSLEKLLDYATPFCTKDTVCLFPKGRSYGEELDVARKKFKFACKVEDNMISDDGKILIISNINKI